MKKILSLLCTVVMVLQLVVVAPIDVHAADSGASAAVTVQTVTASPGETGVQVPLVLADNPGICGMLVTVSFAEGLTLTKVEQGTALSTLVMAEIKYDHVNKNREARLSLDGVEADFTNGTVFNMYFDVAEAAAAGTYEITVTYKYGEVYDTDLNDHTLTITSGAIVVEEEPVADYPTIKLSNVSVTAGSEVTVDIIAENMPGIVSCIISDFIYDEEILELVDAEWKLDNASMVDWDPSTQEAVISFNDNIDVNGVIFTLTFRAKENVEGKCSISCGVALVQDINGVESAVEFKFEPGNVSVNSFIRGDLDANDIVDRKDAFYLLKHTLLPRKYPLNQSGDVDGNGIVDRKDAFYLLKHTLLPFKYPLK